MRRWRYAVYTQPPAKANVLPAVQMLTEGTVTASSFTEAVKAVADRAANLDEPRANYVRVWEEGT